MIYELTLPLILILVFAGIAGGFINTLAGGGSMLTVPVLLMLGMPADVANGTNRIGVLFQSIAGVKGFRDHDKLDTSAVTPVLIIALAGALVGSLAASYFPVAWLEYALLGAMVGMAVAMIVRPDVVMPDEGSIPKQLAKSPGAAGGLFLAAAYGGFVQAGVGFLLIAALAGGLRYDLVRTNALKLVCTAAFSVIALAVFVVRDQVAWIPGLILAIGTVTGSMLSVRFAIKVEQRTIKRFLLVMVLAAAAGALLI